jgi:hypothetical protein
VCFDRQRAKVWKQEQVTDTAGGLPPIDEGRRSRNADVPSAIGLTG